MSESRKGTKANQGVQTFFARIINERIPVYISAVTVGEIRRGIALLRNRNDIHQADRLELWFQTVLFNYQDCILPFETETAQLWGQLRVPHHENALDKQIAATALIHDLVIVTRNVQDFDVCGAKRLTPFT